MNVDDFSIVLVEPLTDFEVVFQVRSGLKQKIHVDIYATRVLSADGVPFSQLETLPAEKVGSMTLHVNTFVWMCRHLCPDKVVIQNLMSLSVESASALRSLAARYQS